MCESGCMLHEERERRIDDESKQHIKQVHDRHSVSALLQSSDTVKITCKSCINFQYCMERTRWYPCKDFKKKHGQHNPHIFRKA